MGLVDCQATLELDSILHTSVDKQKQKFEEYKIVVLFYCIAYFSQSLNIYICLYIHTYTLSKKKFPFVMMTFGEELIFQYTSVQSIKSNSLINKFAALA